MLTTSAWKPAAFNADDPQQRTRTLYLPNAGEYRTVSWDSTPLAGVLPSSPYAQAGIALALAGAIWFGVRHMQSKGLMGLGRPRRRAKKRSK